MASTNLLDDDLDWDAFWSPEDDDQTPTERQPVRMLQTFNTEEQAQLVAAQLRAVGIPAHVVTATTSGMTPFAYGNVRLFVAESQATAAAEVLAQVVVPITENNGGDKTWWLAVIIIFIGAILLVYASVVFLPYLSF
jgi:hypothetical protein